MSTSACRFDHPRCACWCWLLACRELASPRSKTPVVANFIQGAMDGPLGAKQTELANDVSRCAETRASPMLDEGHQRRFLLWCQLRFANTIAVCMRCNASVAEVCRVLPHVDALHSKLKGSLAWPTTARCEHHACFSFVRNIHAFAAWSGSSPLGWTEVWTRMVRGQVQLSTEQKAANRTT